MKRALVNLLVLTAALFPAAVGCAAQVRMAKGITPLGYSIQVGAFSEVKNAERLVSKLQEKGIEAFYFKKENGLYAVRFGDHPSAEAARKAARRLVADHLVGTFFIAAPQDRSARRTEEPSWRKSPRTSLRRLPDSLPAPPREPSPGKEVKAARGGDDMGTIAARTAERFVGIPYRWGGDTVVDGMDCSGFVRAVYNLCGVNIPRTSREQYQTGQPVGRDGLQNGDLLFFGASEEQINHVGIYVGDGKFVHAPRRGDDIKVSSLDEAYFTKKFIGAKRYL
jgi:cell wall-associated NlpC family hydrolase